MVGRSITYRAGALFALGYLALRNQLPDSLAPPQVREAMQAVTFNIMDNAACYDEKGFLMPGMTSNQPRLADDYITSGSLVT